MAAMDVKIDACFSDVFMLISLELPVIGSAASSADVSGPIHAE